MLQFKGLEKYTGGKPFLLHTWTGTHDQYGFKIFLLRFVNGNEVVDQIKTISGIPAAQKRGLLKPEDDFPGSGNPIPEGIYKVGSVISMSAPERGVGHTKIPVDVLPDFRVNKRSEILFHDDFNRAQARGSMGCIVTYSDIDMKRIVSWCNQKSRPDMLVVDYNLGLLKKRGVEIGLGKSDIPKPGIELIKAWEGCELSAYSDPLTGGTPYTIGYGCTRKRDGSPWKIGDRITQQEATDLLLWQVEHEFLPELRKIPGWEELSDNRKGALLSFAWNLGAKFYGHPNFQTISKMLKDENYGNMRGALMLYVNPGSNVEQGLRRRRSAEADVWERG